MGRTRQGQGQRQGKDKDKTRTKTRQGRTKTRQGRTRQRQGKARQDKSEAHLVVESSERWRPDLALGLAAADVSIPHSSLAEVLVATPARNKQTDKARQDRTRQDKARHDKTRQDKTRQEQFLLSVSSACPEPVLANDRSHLSIINVDNISFFLQERHRCML